MRFKEKYGPWAIIAGSAEGLGEAWSTALAQKGLNLIMVDHQEDKLQTLASRLKETYHIQTRTLHLDLSHEEAAQKIMEAIDQQSCRLLVYNAAYSVVKPFLKISPEELDPFIDVNARTQLRLVHAFAHSLINRSQQGGIIMMSSLAGLLGMQLVAPYAATKAFTWNLAEAIYHELKPYGVDVMACIAGATSTPAYLKTEPHYGQLRPQVMAPAKVVEQALGQLGNKALFIAGRSNRINYFILTRLMPRKLASRIANKTMRNMYIKQLTSE